MLQTLTLSSFILIDHATITFDRGFHVLTGETGAGKTLLIQAIHLLSGHKVSADLIRQGEEKATIEATFDIENLSTVQAILRESGIDFDPLDALIIKREVFRNAKNQIFINAQRAPLSLLALLGPYLLELVSQNSSQSIRHGEMQLSLLDLYGDLQLDTFRASYEEEKRLEREIFSLKNRPEELEQLKWELEEWEVLGLNEGEEDTLFTEYKALANSKETALKLMTIQQGLEHPISVLGQFEKLADGELQEHFKNAILHLQEASFLTSQKLEKEEFSPTRLEELEERLSTLNRLKRKYRLETEEIPSHLQTLKEKINLLENLDEKLFALNKKLKEIQEKNLTLSTTLSKKRKKVARILEKRLSTELRSLNLPHAKVHITHIEKEMGPTGSDRISFLLSANQGEAPTSLQAKSSGGEVARFLFALKILLAEKGSLPTLIFDEIDANVGGETATLVGQKLKELGKNSQVLAITHFPQVARFADHHLQISKKEEKGRTLTTIKPLKAQEKDEELLRMLGGKGVGELL